MKTQSGRPSGRKEMPQCGAMPTGGVEGPLAPPACSNRARVRTAPAGRPPPPQRWRSRRDVSTTGSLSFIGKVGWAPSIRPGSPRSTCRRVQDSSAR